MPSEPAAHSIPVQGVTAQPATSKFNSAGYSDPTTAPKTKTCPLPGNLTPKPAGPNQLYKKEGAVYGDFRDDLVRDGYAVVKGVIPRERALAYGDEFFDYLENL